MNWNRIVFVVFVLTITAMVALSTSTPRYMLNSKDINPYRPAVKGPVNPNTIDELNTFFPVGRTDGSYEYYLGSGAAGDTFAVVLEPAAACSVYTVQYQYFDTGNNIAFVANYSQTARDSFPTGRATALRGHTAVSPIGSIIRTFTPNTITATNQWVTADVGLATGSGFVVGNPSTGASDKFVIGFIKSAQTSTRPLADDVTARGFTYTWFGGPWNAGAAHTWGSYSASTATILDIAAQCLVTYPWGSPIIIQSPSQIPNSYSGNGPWQFTCNLFYGTTIGANDTLRLKWRVEGDTLVHSVALTATGTQDQYGCTFTAGTTVPDSSMVDYWVDCVDRSGRHSTTIETPQSFMIVSPVHSSANLLIVTDNLSTSADGDQTPLINQALAQIGSPTYEIWDIASNNGIDQSVTMHGWNNILYIGWGNNGHIPAMGSPSSNPWVAYVNAGHNLMVADQDYFFGAGVPGSVTHNFATGDFAFDKFGVGSCVSDPDSTADSVFVGVASDPISGSYTVQSPYNTEPEMLYRFANMSSPSRHNWNDYITPSGGTAVFSGYNDGFGYGVRRTVSGAKLVLFPCMIQAAGSEDTTGGTATYSCGTELPHLLGAVLSWFQFMSAPEAVNLNPEEFALKPSYPNPFNMQTTIRFSLPKMSKATLKVYNMEGRVVATLSDNNLFAGSYRVTWNAKGLASGVYFARLEAGGRVATEKLMLLK